MAARALSLLLVTSLCVVGEYKPTRQIFKCVV